MLSEHQSTNEICLYTEPWLGLYEKLQLAGRLTVKKYPHYVFTTAGKLSEYNIKRKLSIITKPESVRWNGLNLNTDKANSSKACKPWQAQPLLERKQQTNTTRQLLCSIAVKCIEKRNL